MRFPKIFLASMLVATAATIAFAASNKRKKEPKCDCNEVEECTGHDSVSADGINASADCSGFSFSLSNLVYAIEHSRVVTRWTGDEDCPLDEEKETNSQRVTPSVSWRIALDNGYVQSGSGETAAAARGDSLSAECVFTVESVMPVCGATVTNEFASSASIGCDIAMGGSPRWIGIDRTGCPDAPYTSNHYSSSASIIPEFECVENAGWAYSGVCEQKVENDWSMSLWTTNREAASEAYESEIVTATALGSVVTNRFTVMKVDVTIGGLDEKEEDETGAFIAYVPDATNDAISVEWTNKMVSVSFSCEPDDLPNGEIVRISCNGPAELYEQLDDGALINITDAGYAANDIANHVFKLHGHSASASYKDGKIQIEHLASGAKDEAKYTVVKVNISITDYPTSQLLGENEEELPGAFIPYAADWAFGETQSDDEDVPFGSSAQTKLVDVHVSYEPSDLPAEGNGEEKFLVFEAPQNSLYIPAESDNADLRWIDFVGWWNTLPATWNMAFEGGKRLVLHGHEKSTSPRDCQIRVTHPKSGATDIVKYTVFHLDLDIDSDNNLEIESEDGFEDAIEEREPGKIISWDQSGICPGQDYRVPLRLRVWGGETNAVVRLAATDSSAQAAEIYASNAGGDNLVLPCYFPAGSIPSLFVDGVTNGTITFTATLINPSEGVSASAMNPSAGGVALTEDKVSALIIQPISFAPTAGAAVWSSIPTGIGGVGDGDGELLDSIISNQGYRVTWFRDDYGAGDLDVGGCSANAYLNLDGYGAATIISHGATNEHLAVYFPDTAEGYNAATNWVADIQRSGGSAADMVVKQEPGQFCYVSVKPQWFEDNWKTGFDRRNSIVIWSSCFSATLLNVSGGRWRSGYSLETDEFECRMINSNFIERMNGTIGNGTMRQAGLAHLYGILPINSTSVTMEGNPWTTLCPAPIVGNPTFPLSNLSEGEVAFGCLMFDTFIKEKSTMLQVISGESVYDIAPLRQENAEFPFGIGFRIKKGSESVRIRSEALKIYIESANPSDAFTSGKTFDADRITPNGGYVEWEF